MRHEVIHLCKDDENVTLTTYIPVTRVAESDAMLIIPGGGYGSVCTDREGESVAMAFASRGLRCFVLNYSVGEKARFPRPLLEASLAMAHIRQHAREYGVNTERVFVCGFSAGGHLAGSLGTRWHTKEVNDALDIPYGINRPTGMILCYPVLSYFEKMHVATFQKAFGTAEPTEEQIEFCSVDRNLSPETTAPAFLWHTSDDTCVNVQNTLRMATALSEIGVKFEAHIFPHGSHGLGLANEITALNDRMILPRVAEWIDLAFDWMKTI